MKSPRLKKVKFDTGVILNVMIASLLVQKAPLLIDMVIPLDPSVRAIAGVGAGYLVGMLTKKSEIANASIAIGAIDFVTPFIDQMLGGGTPIIKSGNGTVAIAPLPGQAAGAPSGLDDYLRLNDYVSNPSRSQNFNTYNTSYGY
jgi:hypothetical protein